VVYIFPETRRTVRKSGKNLPGRDQEAIGRETDIAMKTEDSSGPKAVKGSPALRKKKLMLWGREKKKSHYATAYTFGGGLRESRKASQDGVSSRLSGEGKTDSP